MVWKSLSQVELNLIGKIPEDSKLSAKAKVKSFRTLFHGIYELWKDILFISRS